MKTFIRPALSLFILLSIITGLLYPLLTTFAGHWLFPAQAAGSLITQQQQLTGSALIGQQFSRGDYFWGRLSATRPMPYNGINSGGSNLSAGNPALRTAASERIEALKAADPQNNAAIPVDLVTASGSGLDPHISPAAAYYQLSRVARLRQVAPEVIRTLIESHTEAPQLGLLGEARVNVVLLNHALDALK